MNKLISSFLLVTLLVLSFVSCKKTNNDISTNEEMHTVKMWFLNPDMETIYASKSVNETAINNVNVFFFRENQQSIHAHYYLNAGLSSFTATLPKGDYHIYAIANYGSDMGDALTKDQIAATAITIGDETHFTNKGIPMSCYTPLTINSNTSLPIVLTRKAAKVEVNLSVAPTFAGFNITSVQLRNVASSVECFNESRATAVNEYTPAAATGSYTYYVPENAQGVNSSLTDQRQKGPANAPAKATYLQIRGEQTGVYVTYSIYLGANNTSDFNITGNNRYVYDITISGKEDIDTRVTTLRFSSEKFPNKKYTPGATAEGSLTLSKTTNPTQNYKLRYEVVQGTGRVMMDGVSWEPNVDYDFMLAPQAFHLGRVAYSQNSESDVQLLFTLTDGGSNIYTQVLNTSYSYSNVNRIKLMLEQDLPYSHTPGIGEEINGSVRFYVVSDYPVRSDITVTISWTPYVYCSVNDHAMTIVDWNVCSPESASLVIKAGDTKSAKKEYVAKDVKPKLMGGQTLVSAEGISTQPGFGDGIIGSAKSNDPSDLTDYRY